MPSGRNSGIVHDVPLNVNVITSLIFLNNWNFILIMVIL